jgi:hypothetical protein
MATRCLPSTPAQPVISSASDHTDRSDEQANPAAPWSRHSRRQVGPGHLTKRNCASRADRRRQSCDLPRQSQLNRLAHAAGRERCWLRDAQPWLTGRPREHRGSRCRPRRAAGPGRWRYRPVDPRFASANRGRVRASLDGRPGDMQPDPAVSVVINQRPEQENTTINDGGEWCHGSNRPQLLRWSVISSGVVSYMIASVRRSPERMQRSCPLYLPR